MQSRYFFTTAAAVWGLLAINQAYAQSACGNDTCPPGHTCEVDSYENCNYACDDTPDGPGECATTSCETEEYVYCQRAACETDADCGGSMLCHTFAATTCATPACAPGEDCVLVDVEPCSTEEYKQCTPRAELPCETASDCGEGYDCEEAVTCSCSGMASGGGSTPGASSPPTAAPPVPPTDADAPAPADPVPMAPATNERPAEEPPTDCNCSPSGTNYCQLKELPCETDADCPAAFNCVASPGPCWADSEGNTGCSEGSSMCYPESVPGGGMGPTNPTSGPTPAPQDDNGSEETAGEPPRDEDAAPGAEAPNDETESSEDDGSWGGMFALFGCSVKPVAGATTGSSWALVAAGLASLFVRRRRG